VKYALDEVHCSFSFQSKEVTKQMSKKGMTVNPEYIYKAFPYGRGLDAASLIARVPPLLDPALRRAVVSDKYLANQERYYCYGDRQFLVSPGVVFPGEVGGYLFDRLSSGDIALVGKRFLAMGVGAGVELVLAHDQGAKVVVGADIDPISILVSQSNFIRHVPKSCDQVSFIVSDLFEAIPQQYFDVICFNGPFGVPVEVDSQLQRMAFTGPQIMRRFLQEIVSGDYLDDKGVIYFIASNTSDLGQMIKSASELSFEVAVIETISAPPGHRYEYIVTHYCSIQRA